MKALNTIIAIFLIFCLLACDQEGPNPENEISASSLSFTDCITVNKFVNVYTPSIRLTAQEGNKLHIKWRFTEFCCGTDSISLDKDISGNTTTIEIIDQGPFTYCFCPHHIEFEIGPYEEEDYQLTLIESVNAYSRDTFLIHFTWSPDLDSVITASDPVSLVSHDPISYSGAELGGCNGMFKSESKDFGEENDTIAFTELEDTLQIFVGTNQTCCIEFGPESTISGDTLIMRINTLNDDFCDCICYYTFNFSYTGYTGQGFYYEFYVDEYKLMDGSYNLP